MVFGQKTQQEKVDQAVDRAKATLSFLADETTAPRYNTLSTQRKLHLDQKSASEASQYQGFNQALSTRNRRRNALAEQHENYRQFNLKADLLFPDPIDEKRFRRRLSELNKGRFHVVWQLEVCSTQKHHHFHAIIRTECSIEDFKVYIEDCLSKRTGQPCQVRFKLNIESIDNEKSEALFTYNSKASPRLLRQLKPQLKGQRTTFTTGKPYDIPARQLHQQRWNREVELRQYLSDADLLSEYVESFDDQISEIIGGLDNQISVIIKAYNHEEEEHGDHQIQSAIQQVKSSGSGHQDNGSGQELEAKPPRSTQATNRNSNDDRPGGTDGSQTRGRTDQELIRTEAIQAAPRADETCIPEGQDRPSEAPSRAARPP